MRLLCLVFAAVALAAPQAKKSILFLAVDDLRPEIGAYGEDPIPGTHGVRYKNVCSHPLKTFFFPIIKLTCGIPVVF